MKIKKVIILGSGALKIGEAGEFDYSGSQAIKAFKEEGIITVLVNPNIATYQTSAGFADKVYFLPVTPFFVEKIIAKEKPDAIVISFGGQTALNCGMELHKNGVLKKNHVVILGTPIESVIISEDREEFARHLRKLNISTPPSIAVINVSHALSAADKIGYPVMIRAGFALGGQKSGVAKDKRELAKMVTDAFTVSLSVLVEKYLHHFKEIEYEVVRDVHDNVIAVCNMENFDPLGIHTGESIVVAPSQTLTNYEYHFLRKAAIKIVRSLNIVGECNVQFAVDPRLKEKFEKDKKPHYEDLKYYVIELNARLSRSSALASKATGYPLAYVASKLILGKGLTEVKNQVTKVTQSFFEPALDYIVVKIPRWDLEKFDGAEEKIGSSMKSVGEVMAVGRTFEEAIQKAVRMVDESKEGVTDGGPIKSVKDIRKYIQLPTPSRIYAIAQGLKKRYSVEEIYHLTGIDPWFIHRIKHIVDLETVIDGKKIISSKELLELKQNGFSDTRIAKLLDKTEESVRRLRKKNHILPSVFQIDTLAGEVPAKTNYLYLTYNGSHNDVDPLGKNSVIVLGGGPYRIGSSVEFDWSCVSAANRLKSYNKKSIIINCNPETVSTDYDVSDRLYFEELTHERVQDIYEFEKPDGLIVSVGGQTPNNLVKRLSLASDRILGTSPTSIDKAEDRNKFSQLLDDLKIPQPDWSMFSTFAEIISFAEKVGYPVLIRPSYVLSGSAMRVCYSRADLKKFIERATDINKAHPVTISKFMENAKEIELDGVAQNGKILVSAVAEHIENAGVHSGDAHIIYPPHRVYLHTQQMINKIAEKLIKALSINGPFNIQFLAKENDVFVIEINVRASRTFPFLSKATGINFAHKIVDVIYKKGQAVELTYPNYAVVKAPQFSFARLTGADPTLNVEMASTGEVACFGRDADEAYLKAILSTGVKIAKKAALLSLGGNEFKQKFSSYAWLLKNQGYKLYATEKTHKFLNDIGIKNTLTYKYYENKKPNVIDLILNNEVSVVINLSEVNDAHNRHFEEHLSDGYLIRRSAVDMNIFLFTDLNTSRFFIRALARYGFEGLSVKSWNEYLTI